MRVYFVYRITNRKQDMNTTGYSVSLDTAKIIVANPVGYKPGIVAEARKVVARWNKIRAKRAAAKKV